MKKKLCLFFSLFLVFVLSSCAVEVTLEKPYSVKSGTYELKTAVITDMFTDETEEITVEQLVVSGPARDQWLYLFNYSLSIDENTQFIYTKDNRRVVIREGFAFELIAENTFKVHLPYWDTADGRYDIVLLLEWVPRYG